MTKSVYDHPKYYEIAFSYRDIAAEVDTFEACFVRYAERRVKSVLEIGCGNSPHIEELLRRRYAYTGLDISEPMLEYSARKASAVAGKVKFVHADMNEFSINETFDFVYIMLGSLSARNTEELISHFQSVARVLNTGGLFLLDWCVNFAPFSDTDESWSMEQDKIKVTTRFSGKLIDPVEQLVEETISLDVVDDGTMFHLYEGGVKRVIFPQEFLQIIEHIGELEFVGWWNNWNLERPLGGVKDPKTISRPITLLRKI